MEGGIFSHDFGSIVSMAIITCMRAQCVPGIPSAGALRMREGHTYIIGLEQSDLPAKFSFCTETRTFFPSKVFRCRYTILLLLCPAQLYFYACIYVYYYNL